MVIKKQRLIDSIICFLSAIFLIKPSCLPYIFGNTVNRLYTLVSLSICALIVLIYIYKRNLSKIVFLIVLYYAYQIIITFYYGGDIVGITSTAVQFVCICLFSELYMNKDKNCYINVTSFVLESYVYINFLTILLFPEGLYRTVSTNNPNNWFLGYKNQLINYMLPAMVFVLVNYFCNSEGSKFTKKLRVFLLYGCSVVTSFVIWSGATLIISFIMIVFVAFHSHFKTSVFNFRNYLIVNIGLTVAIVILRLQNLFSFIIVDVLNKDITLTGRVYIWDKTLEYISQNYIFGYGVEEYGYRLIKMHMGGSWWLTNYAALHCHCRFLEVMYRGGVILLAIYLLVLITTSKKLMTYKNSLFSKILSIALFSYLLGMITEWYDYSPLFFVLIILANFCGDFVVKESASQKGSFG